MTKKPPTFDKPVSVHPAETFVDHGINAAIATWWNGYSPEDQNKFLEVGTNHTLGASIDKTCLALSLPMNSEAVSQQAAMVRALHVVKYLSEETLRAVGRTERRYLLPAMGNEFWPIVDNMAKKYFGELAHDLATDSKMIVEDLPEVELDGRLYKSQLLGRVGGVAISRMEESVDDHQIAVYYYSRLADTPSA